MVGLKVCCPGQRYVKGPMVTTSCVLIYPVMPCTHPVITACSWRKDRRLYLYLSQQNEALLYTDSSKHGGHAHAAPLWESNTAGTFDPFHVYLYPMVPCGQDEVKVVWHRELYTVMEYLYFPVCISLSLFALHHRALHLWSTSSSVKYWNHIQ